MADSLEWVKWEPKRWLTSEARMRMNATERSIYRDLLDCQYVQGSLPSDERTLAGLAAVTEDEFKIAWQNVKKEFEDDPKNEGRIIQKHAATVRAEAIRRLKSLRNNGLKGGRPRNQKVNQTETKRLTKSLTKPKPNGPLRASSLLLSSLSTDFEKYIAIHPKKTHVDEAGRAWVDIVLDAPEPEAESARVLAGVEKLKAAIERGALAEEFAPNARDFLRNKRYLDDWASVKAAPAKRSRTADTMAAWVAAAPEAE